MNGIETLFIVQWGIWPTLIMVGIWLALAWLERRDRE